MRLTKALRETLDRVCPIITDAGATYEVCGKGKEVQRHPKLFITYKGQTKMTPLASTPHSLSDTINMKKRDVRRILRELGATA